MSAEETDAHQSEAKMGATLERSLIVDCSSFLARLATSFFALLGSIKFQRRERLMSLCETLPLGEKRFLAIVKIEEQRFLIAATNQSIALLHSFDGPQPQQTSHRVVAREGGNH